MTVAPGTAPNAATRTRRRRSPPSWPTSANGRPSWRARPATAAYERAAELTTDDDKRAVLRCHDAARAGLVAGQPTRPATSSTGPRPPAPTPHCAAASHICGEPSKPPVVLPWRLRDTHRRRRADRRRRSRTRRVDDRRSRPNRSGARETPRHREGGPAARHVPGTATNRAHASSSDSPTFMTGDGAGAARNSPPPPTSQRTPTHRTW